MKEIWYDIKELSGAYQYSNKFRFKRSKRKDRDKNDKVVNLSEKIIKPQQSNGYPFVRFHFKNKYHKYYLHLFFAKVYIPNPENKKHVNHKNGIKSDYSLNNLEWATKSEDAKHAWDTGLRKKRFGGEHHNAKLVLNLQTGVFYDCAKDAANSINMNYGTFKSKLIGKIPNNTNMVYV